MLAFGLVLLGALARFLPHTANFSPVLAIALFGGVYLRRSQALWVPLVLMVATDLALGLHATIPFTWGSVILTSMLGLWVREQACLGRMVIGAVASAVLFFVVTNFGAWLSYYPHTGEGLALCYQLAVPFFRITLLSTLVYSLVLFGTYEFIARRVRETRLAAVLLRK